VTLVAFSIPVAVLPWVQCTPITKTFVDFYPGECIDKTPSVAFGIFQGGQLHALLESLTATANTPNRMVSSDGLYASYDTLESHLGSSNETY
jgi:hypothetical protein